MKSERLREKERETVKEKEIGDFRLISIVQRYPFLFIYIIFCFNNRVLLLFIRRVCLCVCEYEMLFVFFFF